MGILAGTISGLPLGSPVREKPFGCGLGFRVLARKKIINLQKQLDMIGTLSQH